MNSDTAIGAVFAALGIFFFVFLFVGLMLGAALFVLQAFGLYRIAQRKGIEHAWLAWIPFAQTYLYAEIIGEEITVGTLRIQQFPLIYVAITYGSALIAAILSAIPVIGWALSLLLGPAIYAASIYVMYRFFKKFQIESAVVFTVISAIFSIAFPFLVFSLREKPFADETITVKSV